MRGRHRIVPTPAVAVAATALIFGCVAPIHLTAAVIPQDEGLLLAYPDLILRGGIPNATFQSVYGPGTLYVLAGFFKLFGPSILVERMVGFGYRALVAAAVYLLLRRCGKSVAIVGTLVAVLATVAGYTTANAFFPSVGLALLALESALVASLKRTSLAAAAVGLFVGLAMWFRPDVAISASLGLLPLVFGWKGRAFGAAAAGLTVGLIPTAFNLAQVGPGRVIMSQFIEPVFVSSSGRRLPLATLSPLLLFCVICVVLLVISLVGVGFWLRRRSVGGRILLSLGLFSVGLLPYAFSRTDYGHVVFAATIPFAAAPLLILLLREHANKIRALVRTGVVVVAVAFVAAIGHQFFVVIKIWAAKDAVIASNSGRSVRTSDKSVQDVIDGLRQFTGGKSSTIAILPADTSKAFYNDTYLYFLFPEHRPGTFYLEMDPGVANGLKSSLSRDLLSVDYVITNSDYDEPTEPNASGTTISQAANLVLMERFKPIVKYRNYTILRRLA